LQQSLDFFSCKSLDGITCVPVPITSLIFVTEQCKIKESALNLKTMRLKNASFFIRFHLLAKEIARWHGM